MSHRRWACPAAGPGCGTSLRAPADVLAERYGPLFCADFTGSRRLYACSLSLVDELCDEPRFDKGITVRLDRFRTLVGNGLSRHIPARMVGSRPMTS